ncbi:peptidoglycan DD-metalloendopeptidase family protein [Streptomyces griseus]|uniref:Peptidoglycan DD-metalloendopeptidase family protein n=1 Tax=Streptomyces stephensoniae TaxID=3375367 RepID=A0ABU2VU74_9ACTN|nr:peptidoglycan DD-metalloendopeptidase family protein [Streptomyces griseus]MDT0489156.1 peptidoglycan DD-metalloendopeptidase family protein [Streptomyces griseus]
MNDQHPHAGPVGYDTRSTGSFDTDPLFGSLHGGSDTRDTADYAASGAASGYDGSYTDVSGHPTHSGHDVHQGHSGQYDSSAWDTGAQQTVTYDTYASPAPTADAHQPWDTGATPAWQQTSDPDPAGQWAATDTGAFPTAGFTATTYGTAPYGTGTYDTGTGAYDTGSYDAPTYGTGTAYAADGSYGTDGYETGAHDSGAYDTGAYGTVGADETGAYATTAFTTGVYDSGTYDTGTGSYDTGTGAYDTGTYDTGAYDATAWNSGATPGETAYEPEQTSHQLYEQQAPEADGPEAAEEPGADRTAEEREAVSSTAEFPVLVPDTAPSPDRGGPAPSEAEAETAARAPEAPLSVDRTVVRTPTPRSRGRRRTPAKRSALLTVAVPSACVMSVAGIAAASVNGIGGEEKPEETTSLAVADPSTVKAVAAANKRLDSQLEQLSEGSDDFRERASRTQERIDLKQRQVAEKKKREEEAARREALRPKFVLPVRQHGLSAYYGQAGVNWMSVHTGIDFPVGYGSPVMAATDGTVRTQYNSAYGNMAIVTMADGTETWYCHLSSTKIRSGPVKAGDVIAYAGSSGNSTGPHLHFEVRPGGGASVDPLAWLRSHGVDPT